MRFDSVSTYPINKNLNKCITRVIVYEFTRVSLNCCYFAYMNHRAVIVFSIFTISVSYLIATKILKTDCISSQTISNSQNVIYPLQFGVRATTLALKFNNNPASHTTTTIDTSISKAFVTGRFLPQNHIRFQIVPAHLCTKSMYLQKEVIAAFQKMKVAAATEGVSLRIISGTRNFWEQKAIWERKWNVNLPNLGASANNAREILKYSSMPSSSRHHWGTDIDMNNLSPTYFTTGKGLKEIQWLRKNASKFGFSEVYSPRETGRLTGYEPEAWHWSYLPLSSQYSEFYKQNIKHTDLKGFAGCEWAKELRIIEDFVGGVSN